MKELISGNHAIARGAHEAGVGFAAGYPGTPSTEIMEHLAQYKEVDAQWAVNEKVAFDEAMGCAIGGVRAMAVMKHVGLNVAADSFMVLPYAGINAGFVVISADDPGVHSSQTEQDNRYFAKFGKVPMLEPSDGAEAKELVKQAFEISEQFESPVMVRTTMRIGHTKCMVEFGDRTERPRKPYERDVRRWAVPPHAGVRRRVLEEKLQRLAEYSEVFEGNFVEYNSGSEAIIASGVSYQYAKEAALEASILKLTMTYPLPKRKIVDFCRQFETVYIVEELEPYLEEQIRSYGIGNVLGKGILTNTGELSPDIVAKAIKSTEIPSDYSGEIDVLPRPPMLCIGCSHRAVYYVLKKLNVLTSGDIGCYTMGCLPPLEAMHTCFSMGASIGNAFGFEKAGVANVVAIIGDSTFVHAGIPALIDMVYNGSTGTVIISDNGTTAMTGQQDHPATGRTLKGNATARLDFEALMPAIGVQFVKKVDAYDVDALEDTVRKALAYPGVAVIIAERPCLLTPAEKARARTPYRVVLDDCVGCEDCFETCCPALSEGEDGLARIDPITCAACGVCARVCPTNAIVQLS